MALLNVRNRAETEKVPGGYRPFWKFPEHIRPLLLKSANDFQRAEDIGVICLRNGGLLLPKLFPICLK